LQSLSYALGGPSAANGVGGGGQGGGQGGNGGGGNGGGGNGGGYGALFGAPSASLNAIGPFHSAHLEWLARAGVLYHRFGADLSGQPLLLLLLLLLLLFDASRCAEERPVLERASISMTR